MRRAFWPLALLAAVIAVVSGLAGAEIYQWTDDNGRVHFAQNLSQVPARYRARADWRAKLDAAKSNDPVQRISIDPAAPDPTASPRAATSASAVAGSALTGQSGAREIYKIQVSRAGTGMIVEVRLNNSVSAPFLIDTGASDVLVPKRVADQLGITLDATTRTKRYSTANGIITRPVVMLRSVDLGGALVENVPASVTPDLSFGLLGLSFFNHFTYNVDAANGILTLEPNHLAAAGAIRGGRSQAQWSSEYLSLKQRLTMIEEERSRTPSTHSRELQRLTAQTDDLERQRGLLEAEADQARVPMAWRD